MCSEVCMNANEVSLKGRTIGSICGGGAHCGGQCWICSPEKTVIIQTFNWSSHRTFIANDSNNSLFFAVNECYDQTLF